jgi:hypothetical protein
MSVYENQADISKNILGKQEYFELLLANRKQQRNAGISGYQNLPVRSSFHRIILPLSLSSQARTELSPILDQEQ